MSVSAQAETNFSSQLFINASNIQQQDRSSDVEGWGLDLKRFYLDFNHRFDDRWSAVVTTDVHWRRQNDPTDVWFRHAYVQRKFSNRQVLQLGVAPLPWIDYIARKVGYRYVDPSLTTMNQLSEPTDLGIHYSNRGETLSYAVSVVTGGGFRKPRVGDSVDVEAYAAWHVAPGLDIAVGGYRGARTQDKDEAPKIHTAERFNASVNYQLNQMRLGIEYAYNNNWKQVASLVEDSSSGSSAWASYGYSPKHSVFVRYDTTKPSRRLNPSYEKEYVQVGWDWKVAPYLTVAVVGKRIEETSASFDRESNEFGLWTMWNF
ncbi:hypothetical protein ACUQ3P_13575 [Gilvimarinus sp. DZF01]|uniref:hypothetical protein n=1 Tax=Gilvimarinus sp. DZF01 TaxID=3461371 RepID=UPI0040468228